MRNRWVVFITALLIMSVHAEEIRDLWLQEKLLRDKTSTDIFQMLEGCYISTKMQSGEYETTLDNYKIHISKKGRLELFIKDIHAPENYLSLFSVFLLLTNNNGYISVKADSKTIEQSARDTHGNRDIEIFGLLSLNWFNGYLYIGEDINRIMFGNNIEVDGGPATTWVKSINTTLCSN